MTPAQRNRRIKSWDDKRLSAQFPILSRKINGKPLVYLDNAATTQKPQAVLDAMDTHYCQHNANIHRGLHTLGDEATNAYENARKTVAKFINAAPNEIIFTKNCTEALNLVAHTLGPQLSRKTIVLTEMEHHSNIVPWQMMAKSCGANIEYVPILADGTLDPVVYKKRLAKKPALVALTHVSNVLGTINPIQQMTADAHTAGALVVIDAAQSIGHIPLDVKQLNCDFLAFSGHKMYGPTGIGVLYGKHALLDKLPPFLTGGGTIKTVTLHEATWADIPQKFEAGTPPITEAIGLGAAIHFLQDIGMENVRAHEQELMTYALQKLGAQKNVTLYVPLDTTRRSGAIAFNLGDIHAHDVTSVLDEDGIAIRSGHHCAQPLHDKLGVPATCRASIAIYNTKEDIDALCASLERARKVFRL